MNSYEEYLLQNQYSQNTVTVHKCRIERFKNWLKHYGIKAEELSYSNLLKYAK